MLRRFFSEQPIRGETATIEGADAQHISRVLRLGPGDSVVLFDGSGVEFRAAIVKTGRARVELKICERRDCSREGTQLLVLAVALPKGDRQRWLVEKAVELGVSKLIPLKTERGVSQPAENVLARLRRHVVEASKQCGRNRLMEIAAPGTLADLERAGHLASGVLLLADPHGPSIPLRQIRRPPADVPVCAAIGPEGGFSQRELQSAGSWQRIRLGPRILRVETAAIAIAAWFSLLEDDAGDQSTNAWEIDSEGLSPGVRTSRSDSRHSPRAPPASPISNLPPPASASPSRSYTRKLCSNSFFSSAGKRVCSNSRQRWKSIAGKYVSPGRSAWTWVR